MNSPTSCQLFFTKSPFSSLYFQFSPSRTQPVFGLSSPSPSVSSFSGLIISSTEMFCVFSLSTDPTTSSAVSGTTEFSVLTFPIADTVKLALKIPKAITAACNVFFFILFPPAAFFISILISYYNFLVISTTFLHIHTNVILSAQNRKNRTVNETVRHKNSHFHKYLINISLILPLYLIFPKAGSNHFFQNVRKLLSVYRLDGVNPAF